MTFASLLMLPISAAYAVPSTAVVDEGALTSNGGVAADGPYIMNFAIYKTEKGGTAVWKEGPVKVVVAGGRFTRILGKSKPLSPAQFGALASGWLGITVDEDPELPRTPLHSVLWSLHSASAAALQCSGCVDGAKLAKGAVSADKIGFPYAPPPKPKAAPPQPRWTCSAVAAWGWLS